MGMARQGMVVVVMSVMCLGFVGFVGADSGVESEKVAPLIKEIERLRSQVGGLDASLEKKEAHAGAVEKELKVLRAEQDGGKSKLEAELESQVAKVKQLEAEVASATTQSEQAHRYAEALKRRAEAAEQSVRDLEAKYDVSHKSFLESKKKALEAEKALKIAEVTISEAEQKLALHGEELSRVHRQWLPPWAASQMSVLQSRAQSKWATHAKPHVDVLHKQASRHAAAAHAQLKPHFDSLSTNLGTQAQKHWKTFSDSASPHVQMLRSKSLAGYEVVRRDYVGKAQQFIQPHIDNVVESSRPYVVVVQKHTRSYVDQLGTTTQTYLNHGRKFVAPYVENVSPYYRGAVSAAVKQHKGLQETVRSNLSKLPGTASFVTHELVWFLASALLALPVVASLFIISSLFGAKKKVRSKRPSSRGSAPGTPAKHHKRAKKVDK